MPYYRFKMVQKNRDDHYDPPTVLSTNWGRWESVIDSETCYLCENNDGKICQLPKEGESFPAVHYNCRCEIVPIQAVAVGNATKDGMNGADYWLVNYGRLPGNYILKDDIKALGWSSGDSPVKFAPGKMIFSGEYKNKNGRLPSASGRIWYECDINYYSGKRNKHRIVYSNDGLTFVTYDHYKTFYEILGGIGNEQRS